MSDERLGQLRRRWQDSRSVADEAEYLRARLRVGDLPPGRLELAAYLGHPAAYALAAEVDPDLLVQDRQLALELAVRLITSRRDAIAEDERSLSEDELSTAGHVDWCDQILEAASDYFACPCEEHQRPASFLMSYARGPSPIESAFWLLEAVTSGPTHDLNAIRRSIVEAIAELSDHRRDAIAALRQRVCRHLLDGDDLDER